MKPSHTRRPLNHHSIEHTESTPFFNTKQEETKKKDDAFFQAKLAVGEKDDKHEREADAVADKVQKKEEEAGKQPVQKKEEEKKEHSIQKMDKKEEEKPVQKMSDGDKMEEKKVQKKEAAGNEKEEKIMKAAKQDHPPHAAHKLSVEERIKQNRGKGQPLPDDVRKSLEHELGGDFGLVVIHTDSEAVALNKELHSIAFTNGFDIYFDENKYKPDTMEGKKLLAHELTHVLQQTGTVKKRQEKKK